MMKWDWKRERQQKQNDARAAAVVEASGDCAQWTPFLTALFDGEADETTTHLARRHLLVCEKCARAWFDWNQTRTLLLSQSAPPPPPSLLWRVLLACRLRRAPAAFPAASPDLSAQILQRTTRVSRPAPAFSRASSSFVQALAPRAMPAWGALVLSALALWVVRSSLNPNFSSPSAPRRSPVHTQRARDVLPAPLPLPSSRATTEPVLEILEPLRVVALPKHRAPLVRRVGAPRNTTAARSLLLARREREQLGEASFDAAPLRRADWLMPLELEPRRVRPVRRQRTVSVSASRRNQQRVVNWRSARLASSAPLLPSATRAVSQPAELRAPQPRVLLASASFEAPLRISAPRVRPITLSSEPNDEAGLEELDSTVQEYRSVLSDDDSEEPNTELQ